MLTLNLPRDMEARLAVVANETGTSLDAVALEAIQRFLEDAEDIRDAERVLANPGRRWTLEELEKGLDLEG